MACSFQLLASLDAIGEPVSLHSLSLRSRQLVDRSLLLSLSLRARQLVDQPPFLAVRFAQGNWLTGLFARGSLSTFLKILQILSLPSLIYNK